VNPDNTLSLGAHSSSDMSGEVTDASNRGFDYWLVEMSGFVLSSEVNTLINHILIYPNPAKNTLLFSVREPNIDSVKIYSTQGELVKTIDGFIGDKTIDSSQLSAGVYFLQIAGDNKVVPKKFIKE
jgi:hypothetical protein